MPSRLTKIVKMNYVKKDSLRGFVTIELNDDLLIRDIRIVEGKHGLFLSWPVRISTIEKEGKKETIYTNIVQPVRDEEETAPGPKLLKHLNDEILEAYRKGKKSEGSGDDGI